MKHCLLFKRVLSVCLAMMVCFGCCSAVSAHDEPIGQISQAQTETVQQSFDELFPANTASGVNAVTEHEPVIDTILIPDFSTYPPLVLLLGFLVSLPGYLLNLLWEKTESVFDAVRLFFWEIAIFFEDLFDR